MSGARVRAAGGGPGAAAGARGRRQLGAVVLLCAAGGGLVSFAVGRAWLRVTAPRPAPLPEVSLALPGRELEPLVAALGVVGLAGVVGLLATRRRGRVAVGAVLAAAGLAVVVRSLAHLAAPGAAEVRTLLGDSGRSGGVPADAAVTAVAVPGWALLAAAGGLLLAVGGLGVLLRGRRWPTLSARYERPGGASPSTPGRPPGAGPADAAASATGPPSGEPTPADGRPAMSDAALWDALDSGDDPTAADDPGRPA